MTFSSEGMVCIFGMAAMPFHCNGILLIQGNLPGIFPMSTLRQASFPIPYYPFVISIVQLVPVSGQLNSAQWRKLNAYDTTTK